jgi:hypothetical protein
MAFLLAKNKYWMYVRVAARSAESAIILFD